MPRPGRPVVRDDGAEYASVAAAARETGATESRIWHSILEGRAVDGHTWRYARETPPADTRSCAACRRWTRVLGAYGRCADGYSAMESDRCDRWVEKLGIRKLEAKDAAIIDENRDF